MVILILRNILNVLCSIVQLLQDTAAAPTLCICCCIIC